MEDLVSVIIPTYNRSALLKEAIKSVISQTYRPLECIVVDDGSTDDTKEVVTKIENANISSFTVKYIFQKNAGSQVARNTGTKASTGKFIQYLDSDDLLYPEKIEKQVSFLNENPECDGVFGNWEKGDMEKKELIEAWESADMLTQLLTQKVIGTLAFLFRKRVINKIGQWDVNIKRNQEIDFQVRGVLAGGVFRYQSQICGLWRIHEGERIANTTGTKEFLIFYRKWEKILNEKGLFNEQMKKNIANIYLWFAWENTKNINNKDMSIVLLLEAVRLNPHIPFFNSKKMKILRQVFPLKSAVRLWWFWAKRNAVNS